MPVEYNKSINAMTPGDEIEGYYILKSANPKVAANGKPFLTGALSDRTGTMELKVWAVPCVSGAASTCWRVMDRITPAARARA